MFQSASDAALRLSLHHVPGRREWRGACPLCCYNNSFVLTERTGRAIGWCASCQDRVGISRLLRTDEPPRPPDPAAERERTVQRERARDRAEALWRGAEPALGTPADIYLSRRALPRLAASPALRFRGDAPHPGGGRRLPALLARVDGPDGAMVALHRTFLRRDGSGKASVDPVKASLGPVWAGAIRLDPIAGELVVAEGIETAASAGRLLGLPAWAAISAGNLARGLVLPAEVRAVVIAADADDTGERAARAAALRWQAEGRRVRIARPDQRGADFNDVMAACSSEEAAYA